MKKSKIIMAYAAFILSILETDASGFPDRKYVPGLTTGGIVTHEVLKENTIFVPALINRMLLDKSLENELKAGGFNLIIIYTKRPDGKRSGEIIKQSPLPFSETKKPGKIQVWVAK